jgi:hypothetical protein
MKLGKSGDYLLLEWNYDLVFIRLSFEVIDIEF